MLGASEASWPWLCRDATPEHLGGRLKILNAVACAVLILDSGHI